MTQNTISHLVYSKLANGCTYFDFVAKRLEIKALRTHIVQYEKLNSCTKLVNVLYKMYNVH